MNISNIFDHYNFSRRFNIDYFIIYYFFVFLIICGHVESAVDDVTFFFFILCWFFPLILTVLTNAVILFFSKENDKPAPKHSRGLSYVATMIILQNIPIILVGILTGDIFNSPIGEGFMEMFYINIKASCFGNTATISLILAYNKLNNK
ncbi:MAG: hypothetical protein KAH48_00155 [Chlorobi bacterium]|nr:hypothetical protein [Chlorobiota bacterium]